MDFDCFKQYSSHRFKPSFNPHFLCNDFNVTAGFVTLADKASSEQYVVEPEFEVPQGVEIDNNGDGTFKAKIHKNYVNNFIDSKDFKIILNDSVSIGKICFAEISLDGNPNEQEYGRAYTTNTNNATNTFFILLTPFFQFLYEFNMPFSLQIFMDKNPYNTTNCKCY